MQDLIRFSFVEWTALFYVFALSKFIKEMVKEDHGGIVLSIVNMPFTGSGGWMIFLKSFFYTGHFLGFIFIMGIMTILATVLLVPHWLISDYLGHHYQLTNVAIYAGFVWAFSSVVNALRKNSTSKDELIFLRQRVIELESQIHSDFLHKASN